jgi:hypothetical protein
MIYQDRAVGGTRTCHMCPCQASTPSRRAYLLAYPPQPVSADGRTDLLLLFMYVNFRLTYDSGKLKRLADESCFKGSHHVCDC